MGSLDVPGAKRQFFELVDAISTAHLPSFTLWLDAKLAEYKTIGQLKPDTECEFGDQYPEWISRALRLNLSFIFLQQTQTSHLTGDNPTRTANTCGGWSRAFSSSDSREAKGIAEVSLASDHNTSVVPREDLVMTVTKKPLEDDLCDNHRSDNLVPCIESKVSPECEDGNSSPLPQFTLATSMTSMPSRNPVSYSEAATASPNVMTVTKQPLEDDLCDKHRSDNLVPGIESKLSPECEDGNSSPLPQSTLATSMTSMPSRNPVSYSEAATASPNVMTKTPLEDELYEKHRLDKLVPGVGWEAPLHMPSAALQKTAESEPSIISSARKETAQSEPSIISSGKKSEATPIRGPRLRKRKPVSVHACTACDAKFSLLSKLTMHQRTHKDAALARDVEVAEGQHSYQTSEEGVQARKKTAPSEPSIVSSGKKSDTTPVRGPRLRARKQESLHACTACDAKFSQRSKLTMYQRIHTAQRKRTAQSKAAISLSGGNRDAGPSRGAQTRKRSQIHAGERPYACSECPATFPLAKSLKKHMKRHIGRRTYACSECFAQCSRLSHLKVHMRRHTGERPYACSQCSATFPHAGSLKAHMFRHTGERPYACSECPARFTRAGSLKKHTRCHTGERP